MSRSVGFTRVLGATDDTATDADELKAAGATEVYVEPTGKRSSDALNECLESLSPGDELIVTRSARLSRSLGEFVGIVEGLSQRGVRFRSLAEPVLSHASALEVVSALDGLRRELISASTRHGMKDAAALGRRPGRPSVMTEDRTAIARELRAQGRSIHHIAVLLGVSDGSVKRVVEAPSEG